MKYYRSLAALLLHAMNLAFANIPLGFHTFNACVAVSTVCMSLSMFLRSVVTTIVPFEAVFVAVLSIFATDIVYGMIKFIPVKDKRTKKIKRYSLGSWLHMPASHRFDLKARGSVKRTIKTTQFALLFVLIYPLLGGLFFQSGIFIQALLIPAFFISRATFEYGADALTYKTFGSDGMPSINFTGVLMHEACLSVMITSIKHPLVFVSLVLSDVLENSYCLWSLVKRNTKKTNSNQVSPEDVMKAENEEEEEEEERFDASLTRRSTNNNTLSLVMMYKKKDNSATALFIAATLLQREVVETLVPIQAAVILTLFYKVDVKSNAIVHGWTNEEWTQSMTYFTVDLLVELVVFALTILALRHIYPEFNAWRILKGLLKMHWFEMMIISVSIWFTNLVYQSTYSGMDMTMNFEWMSCKDKENSTWVGGFQWDC